MRKSSPATQTCTRVFLTLAVFAYINGPSEEELPLPLSRASRFHRLDVKLQ